MGASKLCTTGKICLTYCYLTTYFKWARDIGRVIEKESLDSKAYEIKILEVITVKML